ncbi:flagellar export protein FliJ [Motilimonas cestriensis]|uniref:Flagellar FliJ protein n=1 Tax=Motilimonas cestriensis TaxID=2742685 RepID=A0ABS8WBC6_9GAMM|nr:flagellar export protein FliJ [Motilimonas cestriensis]MCE2595553.1 flagellar export protein FliJ [Motilimonas cestriensis]
MSDKALHLVLEQHIKHEQQAAQEMAQAQQQLIEFRQQFANLQNYRNQYVQQMHDKGAAGLYADSFTYYQKFIVKLENAMQQQQQALPQVMHQVDVKKRNWVQVQSKRKAVESLLAKRKQAAQHKADKQEQKMLDEFSNFQYFQKHYSR